jgi:hypothetical protein
LVTITKRVTSQVLSPVFRRKTLHSISGAIVFFTNDLQRRNKAQKQSAPPLFPVTLANLLESF